MSESANSMLSPSITKVSVTGMKPTRTISAKTNRDLGTRKGAPIGCKVTLREPETVHAFLKNAFWVREHTLPSYNFDSQGNLSFGISDYTDFPDQKYDPDIGIFGMDVNVVLERPGHRVSRRRRRKSRVSISHRIGREESKEWFVEHYELNIVEE